MNQDPNDTKLYFVHSKLPSQLAIILAISIHAKVTES